MCILRYLWLVLTYCTLVDKVVLARGGSSSCSHIFFLLRDPNWNYQNSAAKTTCTNSGRINGHWRLKRARERYLNWWKHFCCIIFKLGLEPWSSGYGWRLKFKRPWVRIPAPYTGWTFGHFLTLICCKNSIVCLKRPKINEKEAGVDPFKNNNILNRWRAKFFAAFKWAANMSIHLILLNISMVRLSV